MRQLSLAKDAGFEQISQNPLFLTVICFVYANEINLGCQPGEMFKNSSSVLIERCIKLLLSGIDDAKTKNLSKIDAQALMNRRSAWPDQKFVGLQFVASQAYLEHLGALSLANLTQHLITFFRDNSHIPECDDILRGLSKSDPLANIAVQLTLSGVLVVIDRRGSQAIYDFPHRSFKEKLAISYFTSPTGLNKLKDKIGDPSFHELVLLVADTKIGWTTITEAIASSIRGPNCDSTGNLLLQALARAPSAEEATRVARHILESAIGEPDSSFYLPKRMQSFLPGDDAYKATLTVLMKRVIQANDYWSFALIAEALVVTSKGDRPHVLQSIQDLLPAASDMDWQTLHIVRGLNDPSELKRCLTWILTRRPSETANDSMTGVFFIALVGQAANREIVRSCLYDWLVQSSDIRARFFEEEETFNQVFDVYAATTKIIDNKVRPYFARGRVPELQRPWR
jgi:hypothetical protein